MYMVFEYETSRFWEVSINNLLLSKVKAHLDLFQPDMISIVESFSIVSYFINFR